MRLMTILFFAIMFGCSHVVDIDKALELSSYLNSLEFAEEQQRKIMRMEHAQILNHMKNMGLPNDSAINDIDNNLRNTHQFSSIISEWKMAIIENTGGYSLDENLPQGWHKTINPKDYLPSEELDSILIEEEKSVLMALIELTNKSIVYASRLYRENQAIIKSKEEPSRSALFLAQSVQTPQGTINGPLFYSFNYYPIDSLQINGKWYFGKEYVEIPREEWDVIAKNNLKIDLPVKFYWGDTTFHFTQKKH